MMVLSLFLACAQTSLGGVSSGREKVILSLVLDLLMLTFVVIVYVVVGGILWGECGKSVVVVNQVIVNAGSRG